MCKMVSQYVRKLVRPYAEGIICIRTGRSRLIFVDALTSTKNPTNKLSCTGYLASWNMLWD